MTNLVSIETHLKVSMSLLRTNEVIGAERSFWFDIGYREVKILHDDLDNSVNFSWNEGEKCVSIDVGIDIARLSYGSRCYFRCSCCRARCEEIHLLGGQGSCRSCLRGRISVKGPSQHDRRLERLSNYRDRLLGVDGRAPPRGSNRQRIVDALLADPATTRLFPELIGKLGAEKRARHRGARRALREQSPSRMAFIQALETGKSLEILPWVGKRRWSEAEEVPLSDGGAKLNIGIAEHHAAIDIRPICSALRARSDGLWAHSLIWPPQLDVPAMTIVAELTSKDTGHLLVATIDQSPPQMQRIRLEAWRSGPGRRWFMICGHTGARSMMLYFRNGVFASARHQRLVHASQRLAVQAPPTQDLLA